MSQTWGIMRTGRFTLIGFKQDNEQLALENHLKTLPTSESFRTHLTQITKVPHPFGSVANRQVGDYLGEVMHQAGLDVATYEYNVYAPKSGTPPFVALVTPTRIPLNNQENIIKDDPYSAHPDLTPGWVAFSGSGDVTAEIVYANYGRKEDFERLREMGISITGKIVLARYGMNYRGYKVKYAQEMGAAAVLMYTDPADMGYAKGATYPEGRFANDSAIQRGSLLTLPYPGDPLTPGQPALSDTQRLDVSDVALPKIPVAPLPYGSAIEIIKHMAGQPVPYAWQGGLPFTYRITGGSELTVRVCVHQTCEQTKATNVIGTLWGNEKPDEWIILGCHYDAWAFGTSDPNSGTALLLTLSEALGKLKATGHHPKRSIRIAHWDAEEFGIMGSTEWVEEFESELSTKAVAYINADMAATGLAFVAAASPSLKGTIEEAAQSINHPTQNKTIHETWMERIQKTGHATFGNLGGGSDHLPFYVHAGVPSAALSMSSGVSVYHSVYDNLSWYEKFADPDFISGPTMATINGVIALRFANADVIPYSVAQYATDFEIHLEALSQRAKELDVPFDKTIFDQPIQKLLTISKQFETQRDTHLEDPEVLKNINLQLIGLEQAWLHPNGLQERPWSQSLFGAEDPFEGYAPWMLPGLRWEIEQKDENGLGAWMEVYVQAVERLEDQIQKLVEVSK
ncbi:MAG: M28 family peptidase [Candidatus Latescibacteria bacterium]|jgi:N-acetylated-alpha-linked acidic dipeptidase|nr:M28 family peptidase [Candidatus Latescibacterota bacterium]